MKRIIFFSELNRQVIDCVTIWGSSDIYVMILDCNLLFIYIQVRHSVIVIPRTDAESSVCN